MWWKLPGVTYYIILSPSRQLAMLCLNNYSVDTDHWVRDMFSPTSHVLCMYTITYRKFPGQRDQKEREKRMLELSYIMYKSIIYDSWGEKWRYIVHLHRQVQQNIYFVKMWMKLG